MQKSYLFPLNYYIFINRFFTRPFPQKISNITQFIYRLLAFPNRTQLYVIEQALRAKDVVTPNKQLRLSLANLNRNVRNCYSRATY